MGVSDVESTGTRSHSGPSQRVPPSNSRAPSPKGPLPRTLSTSTVPISERERQPLQRDLLKWFVPLSIGLHLMWALPWAAILTALLKVLGMQSGAVHWKDVDAPTVIPIDIDSLDEGSTVVSPPPDPVGTAGTGPGPGADAGPPETSIEAGAPDAAPDAPKPTDGGDAGDAGGPPRVKDPNALAGGLNSLKPPNKEVHVSVLVRMDHLRTHPIGKQFGAKLVKIEQWKPFFEGTGIDPVRDLDALYAFGPRFHETSRVSAIIAHNKPDEAMALVMQGLAKKFPGSEWIGDEEVPAFRANIDKADRVVVLLPGGMIITPLDGEKQSIELARQLVRKKKKVGDTLPKGDPDLIVSAFLTKPSNVLTAIPEDLHDVHVTIRSRKDNGGVLDMDAKAKDEKHAKDDAEAVKKLIEGYVPKGFIGMIARKYVEGYTVVAEGDLVHVHHELDGDRIETVWGLLNAGGL